MKQKITLLFLLNLVAFLGYSQCSMEYSNDTQTLLGDFTTLKNYRIDGNGGSRKKIEYSAVLSKGNLYRMVVSSKDGEANGIVMSVYDAKKKLIVTNEIDNEQRRVRTFKVPANGIYYITFTFNNSSSYCGLSRLGVKKVD